MIPTQTLSRFIHTQGRKFPNSTGELSELLVSIALGVKIIGKLVSSAGFKGLHGYTGKTNIQGEEVHALDEEADEILVELLGSSGHFGMLVSEERDSVIATEHGHSDAKYLVAFDPLDGSTNLGSNIPVGTIFGIFRKKDEHRPAKSDDFLQNGRKLVGAGYSVYGAKTSFVYSCGDGVHGFTLDHDIGEFVLTEENMRVPDRGSTYSVNEGYSSLWSKEVLTFISELKSDNKAQGTPYNGRYVGSLVADFDRTLRKGGVFLHPANSKRPRGKLRLLYECLPLSFIVEAAGGRATDGHRSVLDITPKDIHERCPFIVGSKFEVEWFERMTKQHAK
jgi:fructose-1,6-bisphosphatase I